MKRGRDILQRCDILKLWEYGSGHILRLAYCLIYCLFLGLNRGYLGDFTDWIDSELER